MRNIRLISSLLALSAGLTSAFASAAPVLRKQIDQHGDFVMFGNSSGFECAPGANVPVPLVGTATCPGGNGAVLTDSAPDIFWQSDFPLAGQASALASFRAADARTTAMLTLPSGATVSYARIYWAGLLGSLASFDSQIRIERVGSIDELVDADVHASVDRGAATSWYQSSADVTTILKNGGAGAYRVSGIGSVELDALNSPDPMVGWVAVVLYERAADPQRNLAIFDGLDLVPPTNTPTQVTIDGFVVPNAGFDAKLGVITYEGERQLSGDSLRFNGVALFDAQNPVDNFFNGTRSLLGAPVSVLGDLPRLTGGPASLAGIDFDVVNVKPQLAPGNTSATIAANSTNDTFLLGAFITSIATFKPDFTTSGKTFVDVNGGALLPRDVIEYTVTVVNTGNDASDDTVLTDALPVGVSYVPQSIRITSGIGAGAFTDAAGDDRADYVAGSRTIRVRLGTGANATVGGSLPISGANATTTVAFRVTVDANAPSSILNQAIVTAGGAQGAPADDYLTDGNGSGMGVPPTEVVVDECTTNVDCASPAPVCDIAATPNVCVACVTDADCQDPTAPQCLDDQMCGCADDCDDADNDGIPDATEVAIGTDPNDADSDDDGVLDGSEVSAAIDSDGDGLINALDPDSDDDGLFDGTELGQPCSAPATDVTAGHCIADADEGATVTDPLVRDTDDGGVIDGSEDFNHDGALQRGETNPTFGHGDDDDDLVDSDGDDLSDDEEAAIGSDPNDADSDDDGVPDGAEVNPTSDGDGDGLVGILDPDSDNDGLFDGTETGLGCDDPATEVALGHCVPDGDLGTTVTSPVDPDTDHGGVSDGNEDLDRNGVVDPGETNPTLGHGDDDGAVVDSDGDGLSDDLENLIGTDPEDADSDDDGVVDGSEPNFADDSDGDGSINALDPDSDDDGLFDGTELGLSCDGAATDASKLTCIADADDGATRTSPLDPDTDRGGVKDGSEDQNHDGAIQAGETDPNDRSDDDAGGNGQGGAGGENAGGSLNNGGGSAGTAAGGTAAGADSGEAGAPSEPGGTPVADDGTLEGGGCSCRSVGSANDRAPLSALVTAAAVLGLAFARRRRPVPRAR